MNTLEQEYDIVVIGGGTAGPMAAIKAKEHDRELRVLLVDKANVKRSGAISMGMDGLNNAIVPGHATAEQYTREITVANDGIVNQAAVYAYASHSFETLRQLDRWGVRFEKDETGDYAVKKVHHMGAYVLPMPEGHDIKKVLYRQLKRARIPIANRLVCTRLLTDAEGAVNGVLGFDCRSGDFHVIRAKAVILCCGAAGRLGLPSSGYLMGTYENPTNAGDGYAMAYHAGAELANLECFQINPLIKDYNGPACAYVTGPLGGYTANARGERFIECDYWSGQMMWESTRNSKAAMARCSSSSTTWRRKPSRPSRTSSMATNAPVAGSSTPGAAPTTASRWSRCTFPRSASAPATRPPACGSTRRPRPA